MADQSGAFVVSLCRRIRRSQLGVDECGFRRRENLNPPTYKLYFSWPGKLLKTDTERERERERANDLHCLDASMPPRPKQVLPPNPPADPTRELPLAYTSFHPPPFLNAKSM